MRVANLVMGLLFLFSAGLQFNDPDPFAWVAIYGAAAAVCGWFAVGRMRGRPARALAFAIAAMALVWSGVIAARTSSHAGLLQLFESWEMQNVAIEERRETYGLLIVGIWMIVAGAFSHRPRPVAGHRPN
jgi:hypothetical protein